MEQWTSKYTKWMPLPEIIKVEVLVNGEWEETEFKTTVIPKKKPKVADVDNIRITDLR